MVVVELLQCCHVLLVFLIDNLLEGRIVRSELRARDGIAHDRHEWHAVRDETEGVVEDACPVRVGWGLPSECVGE